MCIKCFKVPVSYRWIILLSMACFSSSHLRKPACTTSTVSTTTALATTSITTFAPTISPKKSCFKRTRQSAQLTIPKRQAPTLSLFISTDIRLKCHKKSPLPFAHHRTSLTTHPTTSYTSSTTLTTKTPPNTKISTTPVQSTSTAPIYNIPTTITKTTTPIAIIYTTTHTATINTTTITTWIQILSLMELSLPQPGSAHPQYYWPYPCHHPPHPPLSFSVLGRNLSNWDSGGSPARLTAATQGSHNHLAFLKDHCSI